MEIKNLLKRFVEAPGPPGFEDAVRDLIIEELRDYVDSIEVDAMGNVICVLEGSKEGGPRVMLDAHMDEVSLIVKSIDDDGFIFFDGQGWIDDRTLLSQWVNILTRKGPVKGVIGTKGRHFLTPRDMERVVTMRDMWIDVGATSQEEASMLGVRVGDPIVFDRGFGELGTGEFFVGRCLDDRIGCVVMVQALKELKDSDLEATIYAVGSVQEEVVARGVQVAAYQINPDLAFVIDTGHGRDPATSKREMPVKIGGGPVLRLMEIWSEFMGSITRSKLRDLMIAAAEAEQIPYQLDIFGGGTTDAGTLHLVREGVPTGIILIPRRHGHSVAEVARFCDVENAVRLLVSIIRKLDTKFVSSLRSKVK